jgi:hypothetical protein
MRQSVQDEGLHPAGDDPDWQESVYLAWRDSSSGLGGNHRLGNELNRETSNLWCGVYHDGGDRFRCNGEGLPLERLDTVGVTSGPQRLYHDGESLRFQLDAEGCRVAFAVVDDHRSFADAGARASGPDGAAGAIYSSHFNVACRVQGEVELGGRVLHVDAPAWRDHSWGVRRWNSFTASRSFGGSWGHFQFRYGSRVGADGSFFRRGSVTRDGQELEIAEATMLVAIDDDSIRCPSAEVNYRMADGTTMNVRIDGIGGILGVTRERCGWESVGDVRVDGEAGGWGFLEVSNNPRQGAPMPAYVLDDALTNGFIPAG